jgi:hypothetical protein
MTKLKRQKMDLEGLKGSKSCCAVTSFLQYRFKTIRLGTRLSHTFQYCTHFVQAGPQIHFTLTNAMPCRFPTLRYADPCAQAHANCTKTHDRQEMQTACQYRCPCMHEKITKTEPDRTRTADFCTCWKKFSQRIPCKKKAAQQNHSTLLSFLTLHHLR